MDAADVRPEIRKDRPKELRQLDEDRKEWIPRTILGRDVVKGTFASLDAILQKGTVILEPEIVDHLVPDLKEDIIYIGGSPGKGGGTRRTATKRTARVHKSGRRYKLTAMIIVGNGNGILGLGMASSKDHHAALAKAVIKSKLNVVRVRRGCGSWECGCKTEHSVPFESEGKAGSVRVRLLPAPKGVGIVADKSSKKLLQLAGIKDVWLKVFGNTGARTNLVMATFDAIKNLNRRKGG